MSKVTLTELLKQDIKDLNGLINYEKYGTEKELVKTQAKAILLNIKDHLEEVIKY